MWRNSIGRMTLLAAAMAGIVAGVAEAGNVLYVDDDAPRGGDGQSWGSPLADLQDALDLAAAPGSGATQIWVASGVYRPTNLSTPGQPRSATFDLVEGVSIFGHFSGVERTIDERLLDDPNLESVLTGDLAADDGPAFTNRDDNAYHVVLATTLTSRTALDGFVIEAGHLDQDVADRTHPGGAGMNVLGGDPRIANCSFRVNWAERGGGFQLVDSTSTVVACNFVGNAGETGNGMRIDGGAPWIESCSLSENVVMPGLLGVGGGAYCHQSDAVFMACNFVANHAGQGGGVSHHSGAGEYVGCLFFDNAAQTGGGLHLDTHSIVEVRDCVFHSNAVTMRAGAVMSIQQEGGIYEGCVFLQNKVFSPGGGGEGGAIYVEAFCAPTVIGCSFEHNSAEYGGAIYAESGEPKDGRHFVIEACSFYANNGPSEGGALRIGSTNPIVRRSSFQSNSAWMGGAAYDQGSTLWKSCEFRENHADPRGGGLLISGFPSVLDCDFVANSAGTSGGGGISFANIVPRDMIDCRIIGNSTTGSGGGVYLEGFGTLINCILGGNHAAKHGGGIHSIAGKSSLTNCVLHANSADLSGGGISLWDCCPGSAKFGSVMNMTNSILWDNSSPGTVEAAQISKQLLSQVIVHHSRIEGWSGVYGGIANSGIDPLFVDSDGLDGVVGNEDDDLRLQLASDCIDAGVNNVLPDDIHDLDDDQVTAEFLSLDASDNPRFAQISGSADSGCGLIALVDIGPFEQPARGPQPRRGDLDGNMLINGFDLALLLGQWDVYDTGCRTADLNFDLEVDGLDLAILLGAWG